MGGIWKNKELALQISQKCCAISVSFIKNMKRNWQVSRSISLKACSWFIPTLIRKSKHRDHSQSLPQTMPGTFHPSREKQNIGSRKKQFGQVCLWKSFSTKAKIRIQYSSPLILWAKWQNSYLQDHLHLEILWNTLSYKSVNKNNGNGLFIWLILFNIFKSTFTDKSDIVIVVYFLIYNRSGKATRLQCWCCVAGISSLLHMFQDSTVKFKPYWQTGFLHLSSWNDYLTSTATDPACELHGEEKWTNGWASIF